MVIEVIRENCSKRILCTSQEDNEINQALMNINEYSNLVERSRNAQHRNALV